MANLYWYVKTKLVMNLHAHYNSNCAKNNLNKPGYKSWILMIYLANFFDHPFSHFKDRVYRVECANC